MTQSTIITFHTWSRSMLNVQGVDIDSAEFLSESVSGFMEAPVGIYNRKEIAAKSRKIDFSLENILELKKYFSKLNESNPVFLYQITYNPARIVYWELNLETYDRQYLADPKTQNGCWIVRYATLNDEM